MGNDVLKQKLDILRQHCEAVERPFADIEITALNTVFITEGGMTAQDVIDSCRELASLGFQHVIFNMPNVDEIRPLEIFGNEIIPAVADL